MKLFLKFEKTTFFTIKMSTIFLIFLIFFICFSKQIPQLTMINRTSIVSFAIFFISIFNLIKIFGDFKIGQMQTNEIKNSIILATIVTDLITFFVTFFMGISSSQYFDFYTKLAQNNSSLSGPNKIAFSIFLKYYFLNKILPSSLMLIFVILVQLIIINVCLKLTHILYFKIHKPKNAVIIFDSEQELIFLVSKIIKNSSMWNLNCFIKFNHKNILKTIKENEIVFFTNIPKQKRVYLLKFCYKLNKPIYIYPDIADVLVHNSNKFMIDDLTVFESSNFNVSFEQTFFKRLIDILFSLIFLCISSPIMIIAAILIKLYDKGPVLFKQKRLTQNEKEFNLLKFRSMKINAEKNTGAVLAKENDSRITPVGKFLRRFRIDELPQLLNILKGDLSVVGPRPERREYFEQFIKKLPEFRFRLKVKAGLTGLAQISGKYNTSPKDKLALDLSYIQKYSIWLDIKIILKTLIIFLKSDSTEGEKEINKNLINFVKNKIID